MILEFAFFFLAIHFYRLTSFRYACLPAYVFMNVDEFAVSFTWRIWNRVYSLAFPWLQIMSLKYEWMSYWTGEEKKLGRKTFDSNESILNWHRSLFAAKTWNLAHIKKTYSRAVQMILLFMMRITWESPTPLASFVTCLRCGKD